MGQFYCMLLVWYKQMCGFITSQAGRQAAIPLNACKNKVHIFVTSDVDDAAHTNKNNLNIFYSASPFERVSGDWQILIKIFNAARAHYF